MISQTEHTLTVPYLPETAVGLRVAHLTDLHRDPLTPDATIREAIATANTARPDVIVLTGDFVSHRQEDVAPVAEMLAALTAPLGVYAILGNHDFRAGGENVRRALTEVGITMLDDRAERLACGLTLVGITDDIEGDGERGRALAGIAETEAVFALIHNPADAERFSERACVAVSGHTHGGQVVVPFLTRWKLRSIFAKEYRAGFYQVGKVTLYVNRGVGNVGVPFRFRTPPEVALFRLEPNP